MKHSNFPKFCQNHWILLYIQQQKQASQDIGINTASNDGLHTIADENTCKTDLLTYDSVIGLEHHLIQSRSKHSLYIKNNNFSSRLLRSKRLG